MDKILNSANMVLGEELKVEELEQRLEALVLMMPSIGGGETIARNNCDDYSGCDDNGGCDATVCDDFTCGSTT